MLTWVAKFVPAWTWNMNEPSICPKWLQGVAVGGPKKAFDSAVLALLSYLGGGRKRRVAVENAFDCIQRSNWAPVVSDYRQFLAALGRLARVGAIHFGAEQEDEAANYVWVSNRYWIAAERKGRSVRLLSSDFRSMRGMQALACGMIRWRTRIGDWADSAGWMAKALRIGLWTMRSLLGALEAAGHVVRVGKVMLSKAYHMIQRRVKTVRDPDGRARTPESESTERSDLPDASLSDSESALVSVPVLERRMRTEVVLRSYGLWASDSPPVAAKRAQVARRLELHGWNADSIADVLEGIRRDPSVRDPERFAAALLARQCEFSRWLDQGSHDASDRVLGLLEGLIGKMAVPRDPVTPYYHL